MINVVYNEDCLPAMRKKYQIVYADPAWKYDFSPTAGRAIERHYPTMDIETIKNMPISKICSSNCILFLWATFPKLLEACDVIHSWGFKYRTVAFVWIKSNKKYNPQQSSFFPYEQLDSFYGMGHYTRANAEICMIGKKGAIKAKDHSIRQIIYAPIGQHSQKPDEVRNKIVQMMGDLPRIELFARQKTDGWDVWGNEVKSDIALLGSTGKEI